MLQQICWLVILSNTTMKSMCLYKQLLLTISLLCLILSLGPSQRSCLKLCVRKLTVNPLLLDSKVILFLNYATEIILEASLKFLGNRPRMHPPVLRKIDLRGVQAAAYRSESLIEHMECLDSHRTDMFVLRKSNSS